VEERIREAWLETPAGRLTYRFKSGKEGTEAVRTSWRIKAWICDETDVEKFLSIPDEPVHVDFGRYYEIKDKVGEIALVKISIPDPICVVCAAVDREQFLIWCYEKLDMILEMVQVVYRRMLRWLETILPHCSGDVFWIYGPEYVLPPLLAPDYFDLLVAQFDAPLVELIHRYGCLVNVHSHGKVGRFLEKFADLGIDALDVLEPPPQGDVDLTDAKARIGDRVCLIGNIQYDDLERRTSEEIYEMAGRCIDVAAEGGGFVLAPTASPFASPCSKRLAANYISLIRAARDFGTYEGRRYDR